MALPAPNLDDRRFQDLVDEAKRAIPRHCPEWTNHNLNDPGVALIELFAWMSEQMLFRLNQVPERMYVHFLNLVGIDPFAPGVARTDLTFWLSTALDQDVVIPAGIAVATGGESDASPVVFTTVADLVISPPRLGTVMTSTAGPLDRRSVAGTVADVTDDLRYGTAVATFPSDPLTPGDALYFGFEASLSGVALALTMSASAEGVGVDPLDPPLAWEVWAGDGWLSVAVHEDTTGGLNRDGRVLLFIPQVHKDVEIGGVRAYWLRCVLQEARRGQPAYRSSPQLRAVRAEALGGTVGAEHAEVLAAEVLGRSNGRPGQVMRTSRSPVWPRRGDEGIFVTDNVGLTRWTEVADFSGSGPNDRHVVWDSATGEVRFGPAVRDAKGVVTRHGAAPPDGATVSVSSYRVGGGTVGNVGARTLVSLRTPVPFVSGVVNNAAAIGGVDAETVAEAKVRGPMTLRTGMRAVTPGDFERIAREASIEVARARCLPAKAAGGPVRLLVVPQVRRPAAEHTIDDFALDEPLVGALTTKLDACRLVGTAIEIGTPFYQGVSVAALVISGAGRPALVVRQRVVDTIAEYLNPLTGGPERSGWQFDTDVTSALLAQLVESIDGVERVEELLLFEYDLRTGQRTGPGRDIVQLATDSLFLSAAPQVVVK